MNERLARTCLLLEQAEDAVKSIQRLDCDAVEGNHGRNAIDELDMLRIRFLTSAQATTDLIDLWKKDLS